MTSRIEISREVMDIPDDPHEANDLLYRAGLTDGLPVLPPVSEHVRSMMEGFPQIDPKESVTALPPRMGHATLEKIAANAVMAGCRSEYMPILIAAILAISEESYGLGHRQVTTHAGAPLIIVNGPIIEEVGLNYGTGVFGPGWRANATIGRALRLILMNIGGAIPSITDMSQHGHPGKYTFCIAENESANPWDPLHVERGFGVDESVVTVVNAEAPHSITDNTAETPEQLLTTCASSLSGLGSNNLYSQGNPVLVLGPEHARMIADHDWSKRDVQAFIFEVARQPWSMVQGRGKSLGPVFPKWVGEYGVASVPIINRPEDLIVIVSGGAGGKSMGMPTAGAQSLSVSRRIVPGSIGSENE